MIPFFMMINISIFSTVIIRRKRDYRIAYAIDFIKAICTISTVSILISSFTISWKLDTFIIFIQVKSLITSFAKFSASILIFSIPFFMMINISILGTIIIFLTTTNISSYNAGTFNVCISLITTCTGTSFLIPSSTLIANWLTSSVRIHYITV